MKKLNAILLAGAMLATTTSITAFAEEVPYPTATVVRLSADSLKEQGCQYPLTFALSFHADTATQEQLDTYGDWYADFELTFNKPITLDYNDENADGYLAGQYDYSNEYYEGKWVAIPGNGIGHAISLDADETLQIMKTSAELLEQSGLRYTYEEVYTVVQDFRCGVYLSDEYIEANPDIEARLELRVYNPADESDTTVIGKTYIFNFEPKSDIVNKETTEITKDDAVSSVDIDTIKDNIENVAQMNDMFTDISGVDTDAIIANNDGADSVDLSLDITLTKLIVSEVEDTVFASELQYDVHPVATIRDSEGTVIKTTDIDNGEFHNTVFRIPVPNFPTSKAQVIHHGDATHDDEILILPVNGGTGEEFVELSTDHFSLFTISTVNDVTWVTATDSGLYNDSALGMMRFLFDATPDECDVVKCGIKYLNASDITADLDSSNVAGVATVDGSAEKTFMGDIVNIPTDETGTYYAIGYVQVNEKTFWSLPVPCTLNTNRIFTEYTPN